MTLGLIEPLTEMSTTNIFWGVKADGAKCWQLNQLHVANVLKPLNILEPSGPVQARKGISLTFWRRK